MRGAPQFWKSDTTPLKPANLRGIKIYLDQNSPAGINVPFFSIFFDPNQPNMTMDGWTLLKQNTYMGSIPHICHFFTQAKFLENKIYTKKTRKLRQNTQ